MLLKKLNSASLKFVRPTNVRPIKPDWFVPLLLPLLFLGATVVGTQWRGSYWLGYSFDPSYPYLLNGLNLINGAVPGHTDHPGTPLQILISLMIQITYALYSPLHQFNLTDSVLSQPEIYLSVVNYSLLALITMMIGLVGYFTLALTQRWGYCLLVQSAPFLCLTPLNHATQVSPEPLLLAVLQSLAGLLLLWLFRPIRASLWFAAGLGAVLGLALAIKVTCLPLLALFWLFSRFKQLGLALATLVLSFVVCTIPVISEYPRIFGWLQSIAIHTERYGRGKATVVDPAMLMPTFKDLVRDDRSYFVWLAVAVITLLFLLSQRRSKRARQAEHSELFHKSNRLFQALLAANLILLVLTLKHPAVHYLLPLMSLMGVWLLTQGILLQETWQFSQRMLVRGAVILSLFMAMLHTSRYLAKTESIFAGYQADAAQIASAIEKRPNCRVIYHYRASTPAFALRFGNDFANRQYSKQLANLYPDFLTYNLWTKQYSNFIGQVNIQQLWQQQRCLLLQGSSFTGIPYEPAYGKPPAHKRLKQITPGDGEVLYRFRPADQPATQ